MSLYNIKNWWLAASFVLLTMVLLPAATLADQVPQQDDSEEERWFQIELIIFAHKTGNPLEAEKWPKIVGLSLPDKVLDLALPGPVPKEEPKKTAIHREQPPIFEPVPTLPGENIPENTVGMEDQTPAVPMPVAFEMLRPEELDMNDVYKKLVVSSKFEPMLHIAWRQPTYDSDKVQSVFIFDGMKTDPVEGDGTQSDEKVTSDMAARYSDMGPINPRFAGTVSLSVSRYLHFESDLIYRTLVKQQQAIAIPDLELWDERPYPTLSRLQGPAYKLKEWNSVRGFRLLESRRMRSKKIHYLDNPFFGIIVLVTHVELPKPPEETAPDLQDQLIPSTQLEDSGGSIPAAQ